MHYFEERVQKELKEWFENFPGRQHRVCANQRKVDRSEKKSDYIVRLYPREMRHSG